ncbi:YrhB domain-containing protein [Actinomadura fulvescens]|uniref:Immunity protein 35 domain-containing protein n=1 Tax=Actinomadura fulvescens TaxID=46160 RepID=A0ABN3PVJ8_9ACTN
MDIDQARRLAEVHLAENSPPSRPVALFEDELVEDLGWCFVFPWNTARYGETRDMADIIGPRLRSDRRRQGEW